MAKTTAAAKAAPIKKATKKVVKPITERVKNLKQLFAVAGINPDTYLPYKKATNDEKRWHNAAAIARLLSKVLNEGWVPDWDDHSQRKWRPWFYMNTPGFRFLGSVYVSAHTNSGAGSGLCFKSEELSDHAAKYFPDIFKDLQCL
jgi:hypothetical protein